MIRIRVDDFPHTKGEPQHSLDAFRQFHRELTALTGKRYLLGVIPKRCTAEDILFLRNETDCVIGMHGIEHNEQQLNVHQNEFPVYLSKQNVRDRLAEAKQALEAGIGRPSRIYMPPRNLIDQRTASVLNGLFDHYTSGPETDQEVLHRFGNYIPSVWPHEYGRSDEMLARESHIAMMQKSDHGHSPVLTLHWTWETNIGLQHLRAFLSQIPRKYFEHFDDQDANRSLERSH